MTSMTVFAGDPSGSQVGFAPPMAPGMMHRRARQEEHGFCKVSKRSKNFDPSLLKRDYVFFSLCHRHPGRITNGGSTSLSPHSGARSTVRIYYRIMASMNLD